VSTLDIPCGQTESFNTDWERDYQPSGIIVGEPSMSTPGPWLEMALGKSHQQSIIRNWTLESLLRLRISPKHHPREVSKRNINIESIANSHCTVPDESSPPFYRYNKSYIHILILSCWIHMMKHYIPSKVKQGHPIVPGQTTFVFQAAYRGFRFLPNRPTLGNEDSCTNIIWALSFTTKTEHQSQIFHKRTSEHQPKHPQTNPLQT